MEKKVTVYYDERLQDILTEEEVGEVADEYTEVYELYIDMLREYDWSEIWEMLRPEVQNRIFDEAREAYIKENCISREIEV